MGFRKIQFTIIFTLSFGYLLQAQVCNGSIGENIFTRGDFGSGTSTDVQSDPGIAPGYSYTTSPPPQDGFYTITNNTGAWTGLFPTWVAIRDNSDDPSGYMMVVNASFTPGIFYEEVVDDLCPNTLYEFSADVINLIQTGVQGHILPNVAFLLDDVLQYETGDIVQSETWNQYGFTFTTGPNQTEVKLTLRNNAPGGIGNDLALDNISFRPCGPQSFIGIDSDTTIFLCEESDPLTIMADIVGASGQVFSIQWQRSLDNEVTWEDVGVMNNDQYIHDIFSPGDYFYRYLSASNDDNLANLKCRVISEVIRLTVLPKTKAVADTTCQGVPYIFGARELSLPGSYIDTFQSALNCDSIVFLELAVVPDAQLIFDVNTEDPSCTGFTDGVISISNIRNAAGPFSILVNNNTTSEILSNLSPGTYQIAIVDRHNCSSSMVVELINPEEFVISTIENQQVLLGDEIQVSTTGNYALRSVVWENATGLSCTMCPDPVLIPQTNDKYVVSATNEEGCVALDSFFVEVERDALFYVPNVFSPNEDGLNDVFFLSSYRSSVLTVNRFVVADRWGNLVFDRQNIQSNDLNVGWKPSENVAEGVYTYYIEVTLIDNTLHTIKGDITLVR